MSSLNVLNGDGTHFLSVSEGKGLETLTRVVVENSDSWAFLWKWGIPVERGIERRDGELPPSAGVVLVRCVLLV